MAFTYILFSGMLDKYYVGATNDAIEERLRRHLSNHDGFTSKAKDWNIVYYEEFDDISSAMKREKQIKKWKSRKLIEQLFTKVK